MKAEEIKKVREEKGLSKSDFAKLIGVTALVYGRYESGSLAIPEKVEKAVKELEDQAVASEIEVKKARSTARKATKYVENAVQIATEDVAENAVATEIEVKKKVRSTSRKAKKVVEDVAHTAADEATATATEIEVKKKARSTAKKAREAVSALTPSVLIESLLGGTITVEEVLKRVPAGVDAIYIKPEENKAYWVKGDETGSIELW